MQQTNKAKLREKAKCKQGVMSRHELKSKNVLDSRRQSAEIKSNMLRTPAVLRLSTQIRTDRNQSEK